MPSSRAVVTAFCAAHARLGFPSAWAEYSSHAAPDLCGLFDARAAFIECRDDVWWERFFACGIIGALESARLWHGGKLSVDSARVGICFSSSKGRPAQLERSEVFLENSISEYSCWENSCDWALREIARKTGAVGKRMCPVAACAGGAHAIAIGAQWIEDGACDVVICGAIEAELADLVLAGYRSLGALSASEKMRPFDAARDGFVPAPGAACLVLEREESARKRGAGVLGAVSGRSLLCDGSSLTGLEQSGAAISRAMQNALQRARRWSTPERTSVVDYVNAHGTATRLNDEVEARAIQNVLGARPPVSSTKPLTGHTLGAAGAIEALLCLLAIQQNFAPPNLNLQTKDANCEINILESGREMNIETALSLSYGFGGHIGVLVFEKN